MSFFKAQLSCFRIWDVSQKSLYLQNNELVAGYLQGPNSAVEGESSGPSRLDVIELMGAAGGPSSGRALQNASKEVSLCLLGLHLLHPSLWSLVLATEYAWEAQQAAVSPN